MQYYHDTYYFDCQCSDATHTLRFCMDSVDGQIWCEVQLRQYKKWHQRIWMAIKYIFGHQSKYGYYDCTLLRIEDYNKFREMLNKSEKLFK